MNRELGMVDRIEGNRPFAGVISDTHGLLRPEAKEALKGAELIIHAGDVGKVEILEELGEIAPVVAVRGNVDYGEGVRDLPLREVVEFGGHSIYLLHIFEELELVPAAAEFSAVIFGHSHSPAIDEREGVIYMNPGSAGPRRFSLPVTLGRLFVTNQKLEAEIVTLI